MSFSQWLSQIALERGWSVPGDLRAVLVHNGCHCTGSQLLDWLEGGAQPSYDKMRSILSALQTEVGDVDVWEHYRRFTEEGPSDRSAAMPTADPATLESVLRDNPRLPPGLSDA